MFFPSLENNRMSLDLHILPSLFSFFAIADLKIFSWCNVIMLYCNWGLITVDSDSESLYFLFYLGPLYILTEFVELALMNRLAIMLTPTGWKECNTKA